MSRQSPAGIKIVEIDHIVIRCKDVERQLKFYVDILGLEPYRVEEYRAGKVFFPSVRVNDGMIIDLFPKPNEEPVGDGRRNLDHYCLTIAPTDLAQLASQLQERGVTVEGDAKNGREPVATATRFMSGTSKAIELSYAITKITLNYFTRFPTLRLDGAMIAPFECIRIFVPLWAQDRHST